MADPLRFCDVWPPHEPELRPWYVVLGEGIAGPYGEQEDLLMAGEGVWVQSTEVYDDKTVRNPPGWVSTKGWPDA